jgi:hypothetical protein
MTAGRSWTHRASGKTRWSKEGAPVSLEKENLRTQEQNANPTV